MRIAHLGKVSSEETREKLRKAASKCEKTKAPNYEKNRQLQRKYSVSAKEFEQMLVRQKFRCLGCQRDIRDWGDKSGPGELVAHVDHEHLSGKVRGLLCDTCNRVLGFVKEAPLTLRRLIAYLDYDRTKCLIFLSGALKNTRIPEIGNLLRAEGFDVMDEWWTPGPKADEYWQNYEKIRGRVYPEAVEGRAATNIYMFDRAYIDLADIMVLVMPAGKSAMLELGYSIGKGKRSYLFLDGADPKRYDIMPAFADKVLKTEKELVERLRKDKEKIL